MSEPLTAEDRLRVQGIREMTDAARDVNDLAALWSAEKDFYWLLAKAEATLDAARDRPGRAFVDHRWVAGDEDDGCCGWQCGVHITDHAARDLVEPHPGRFHEFVTTCTLCGEPGMLHINLITPGEVVHIEDAARLAAAEEEG